MAKDKTKQGSSKPISKGNETKIEGANFFFTGDLYQTYLKIIFLCFKNSDICQLMIKDGDNSSVASDVKKLFSTHSQKYSLGQKQSLADEDQNYMTVRQFREFFLLNSNLFKILFDTTSIEVRFFKKSSSIAEFFNQQIAKPISLYAQKIDDNLLTKNDKTPDEIRAKTKEKLAALLPPQHQLDNCHFYPDNAGNLTHLIAINQNKIDAPNGFDMAAILTKIAEILTHDTIFYDDIDQE